MGNYSTLLIYYVKALNIRQKSLSSEHPHLALNYKNIAIIHHSMSKYIMTISYLEKTLDIHQKSRPSDHLISISFLF